MKSLSLAFIIFVWLRTNGFVDVLGWLLKRGNIFYVRDFVSQGDLVISQLRYPLWLYTSHPNFLTRLLSCPLCLSFWLNLLFAKSINHWLTSAFITLLAFVILDKLYKHGTD